MYVVIFLIVSREIIGIFARILLNTPRKLRFNISLPENQKFRRFLGHIFPKILFM